MKYNLASDVTNYVNALNSVGCNICIDKPTCIAQHNKSTCIDHIYSNYDNNRLDSKIITSDISDHFSTLTKVCGIDKNNLENDEIWYRKTNLNEQQW